MEVRLTMSVDHSDKIASVMPTDPESPPKDKALPRQDSDDVAEVYIHLCTDPAEEVRS